MPRFPHFPAGHARPETEEASRQMRFPTSASLGLWFARPSEHISTLSAHPALWALQRSKILKVENECRILFTYHHMNQACPKSISRLLAGFCAGCFLSRWLQICGAKKILCLSGGSVMVFHKYALNAWSSSCTGGTIKVLCLSNWSNLQLVVPVQLQFTLVLNCLYNGNNNILVQNNSL